MNLDEKLPALRALDITPLRTDDGDMRFALHDLQRVAPASLAVSLAGYFVLAHLDGEHSCADIQAAFQRQFGMQLPADGVFGLVGVLDDAVMLRGERFERAYAERKAAYRAAPARDNRLSYPDASALRAEIERILAAGSPAPVRDVRGLVAPHLDYRRGAPCYADAYATLAKVPPADRYVILGTNHFGESTSVVATTKDFHTALGLVRTDREFIGRLEELLGEPLCEHDVDHLSEHSVDLQIHILQAIMAGREIEIVPVLCPNPCGPTGTAPSDGEGPDLAEFADALGRLIADDEKRTVLIAGADLSHVGQRFGDAEATTPETLAAVARYDRSLLSLLAARDDDGFLARISATDNATRICSAGCIYALLRALPDRPCQVLSYHQAVDLPAQTHVTCAAMVVS